MTLVNSQDHTRTDTHNVYLDIVINLISGTSEVAWVRGPFFQMDLPPRFFFQMDPSIFLPFYRPLLCQTPYFCFSLVLHYLILLFRHGFSRRLDSQQPSDRLDASW